MSSSRQTNQIDLTTAAGQRTVTIAGGGSVQFQFNPQQARIGASGRKTGMYNNVTDILLQFKMVVNRADGAESDPIYPDVFPRAVSQISLQCPMFGTLIDPNITTGMLAKHVLEFFGLGYDRAGVSRQPIPSGNGDYTRYFEICVPFSQGWNENPDQFSIWLGWLDSAILEIFRTGSATPFGIAGVTITSLEVSAILATTPVKELLIPPFVVLQRYQQAAAAGSNGPMLMNVGGSGSLNGVDDGSRLLAMLFAHQSSGFEGSGTADQIAQITIGWRDQLQTNFASMFFERFIRDTRRSQLGIGAGIPVYDNVAPYPMSENPAEDGALNDPSARYTPLVWTPKGGKISQVQKVKGNYPLTGINFSSPQSASFNVYTLELKQFNRDRVSSMLVAAGIDPTKVTPVPKLNNKKPDKGSKYPESMTWGFPRNVRAVV